MAEEPGNKEANSAGAKATSGISPSPSPPGTLAPPPEPDSGTDPEGASHASDILDLGESVTFRESVGADDAFIELQVSPDGMEAHADLHPPRPNGAPLSMDHVEILLSRLGIVFGVDQEGLGEAIIKCNLDGKAQRGFLVAQGKKAQAAVAEHAVLSPNLSTGPGAAPEEALHYDFRERRALIVVRKGQVLATITPASQGVEGMDLRGNVFPAPREGHVDYKAGKNVERRSLPQGGEVLLTLVDGLLGPLPAEGGGTLQVEEILLVRGDVDYHTGHIIFPGDVVIEGAVGDGFKVWSGASIRCKATMDAFDVNAKKDLVCDQGIIGRKKAQVRVGGELRAKFVQNCRVAVRGDIHVQSAIVNSRVYCLGRIDLGDKGTLLGGEVYAVHGIKASRLGNAAGQATLIRAGTDFTVQQRLDQANERLRILSLRTKRAREEASGPALDSFLARAKLEEETLRGLIGDLLTKLDADEDATVEISGQIHPGAVIEICRVSIAVEAALGPTRFRLDKGQGKIVAEKLTRKG